VRPRLGLHFQPGPEACKRLLFHGKIKRHAASCGQGPGNTLCKCRASGPPAKEPLSPFFSLGLRCFLDPVPLDLKAVGFLALFVTLNVVAPALTEAGISDLVLRELHFHRAFHGIGHGRCRFRVGRTLTLPRPNAY